MQNKILELFTKNKRLRFSDIEKATQTKSNTLAYHLENLTKQGILKKEDDHYILTNNAETMIPMLAQITGKEKGVLPVVLMAILDKDKILLLKRNKRPYKGYWGIPGGKLRLHESVTECAIREAQEETGLKCNFSHIASVIHERVEENKEYKHAFLFLLAVLKPETTTIKESEEGKLEWFPIDNLQPDRIIPSDYNMIKEHITKKTEVTNVIMEEKEEKLIKFLKTKY
ncbi:NUDIX domain-containing protein [Candidatus Woesearchaeota archaeon]|nr:NUDIX domain-containing protein [Candidatus Woesearchaeota archaeon]MBW3016109.1 NUDIX domain-containing protein [Candidatus Woesearchaeota archaeon]